MLSKRTTGILATSVMVGLMALPASAQTPPAGGAGGGQTNNGNGGGRQGRGNFDPAQFRQRMMDQLKDQMGMSDDDFKAVQPKIEAVESLERDAASARFGGMGGRMGGRNRNRGGDNAGGGAAPGGGAAGAGGAATSDRPAEAQGPVATAAHDLQEALDNKDAKPDDIKAKLAAYRDAKNKNKDQLTKAQQELKELLTQRQEAVLVMRGMLD